MDNIKWYAVCTQEELEVDDVVGFEHNGKIFAVIHIESGFYAIDGLCSHEQASLVEGYVYDDIVECPKHNARFNVITGRALKRPACIDLNTYPIKEEEGKVFIGL